ncbi:MAG: hypothetical protein IPL61_35665 [Myxococcales bacterium]|nr:hypothetical protein [Myxococcales bacterium]
MLGRALVPFAGLFLATALVGCGPSASGDDIPDLDAGTGQPCTGSGTQCVGNQYETCRNGEWVVTESCATACNNSLGGCVECNPGVNTCNGNAVVACNSDGTFGNTVEACAAGTECAGGMCMRACSADGVDLIYVVDDTNNLLSFDPRNIGTATSPFRQIGQLSCPAGPSLTGGIGPATPFSMAVDRDATAWVLYSSGEIFNVSTANAACSTTSFVKQQNAGRRWDVFGMGYVTDTAGGDTEKLWIGGGDADAMLGGDLGVIAPGALTISRIGALTATVEYGPELTGLGDATLWGFYPGTSTAFVQQIDKTTGGGLGNRLSIPGGLGGTVAAWAFAQWGGKFYVFVTTSDILGNTNSTVRSLDRATGAYQSIMQNLPYRIVGAGVSTCAPVVIGRELPYDGMRLPLDGAASYAE